MPLPLPMPMRFPPALPPQDQEFLAAPKLILGARLAWAPSLCDLSPQRVLQVTLLHLLAIQPTTEGQRAAEPVPERLSAPLGLPTSGGTIATSVVIGALTCTQESRAQTMKSSLHLSSDLCFLWKVLTDRGAGRVRERGGAGCPRTG